MNTKTTVEIPDLLFRRIEATAAERGQSLEQLITEALQKKLAPNEPSGEIAEPDWMRAFGKLHHLRSETAHVQTRVDEAFGEIEEEERE